jgi:tripartite ATP-independent transporter DctM subunit
MTVAVARRRRFPVAERVGFDAALRITMEALPSLFLIVLIIGGITFGIFTAVEASGIAVVYTMLLAFVIHRTMPLRAFPGFLLETAQMTGTIMLLLAASAALSFVMAFTGIPAALTALILGISENPIVVLLIINLLLLVVGCFMDIGPAILIFTPILLPIAQKVGMDPVHFGVMLIFNLAIGTITPPVGSGLFVGASVAKIRVERAIRALLPFYVLLVAILLVVTYVPALTLALPRWFGL